MKWISVEDGLPINYKEVTTYETKEVIIACDDGVEACEFRCGPDPTPWYEFEDFHNYYVTHWMPLPEPPEK